MSDTGNTAAAPAKRYSWLMMALIASLAVNLLFVGAGVARFYVGEGPVRGLTGSQMQLIPRKFFAELDRSRRSELLGVFKSYDKQFRDGRREARAEIAVLATALEAEPYDAAQVNAAVSGFTAKSTALVATGGQAALKLIGMLTPDERKLLARHLRMRDERGRGRPDGGPGDKPSGP
jgi:uncharacterized membrane protein